MGSKAGDVWKFVVPVLPCGSSRKKTYPACLLRSTAPGAANCKSGLTSNSAVDLPSTLQQLRAEISAVGARVSYVDEQMEHIKAALPDLDSKIRYASLGMPLSSLSLEEMLHLKGIHFKLLQFWEELSRKQLEKLGVLSDLPYIETDTVKYTDTIWCSYLKSSEFIPKTLYDNTPSAYIDAFILRHRIKFSRFSSGAGLQVLEEQRARAKSQAREEPLVRSEEGLFQEFEQRVNEKVESDLQMKQELETKLYVDRISTVSDYSKPTELLPAQIPPERGPQGFASEQQIMGAAKKPPRGGGAGGAGEPSKLHSEAPMEPQLVLDARPKPARGATAAPTPPPTPSGIAAAAAASFGSRLPRLALTSLPRCKERRGASSAAPATPLTGLQPVQVPSSIQV